VQGAGGAITYDTAKAAMGAAALVDMAGRAAAGLLAHGDAGATPDPVAAAKYANAAGGVFNHLYARARDASGFYLGHLVTSADPGHDAVDSASTEPAGQLDTDVQATVSLAFLRASGIATHYSVGALSSFPFADRGSAVVHLAQTFTPALWDTTATTATTAACNVTSPPLNPCGSGFFASVNGSAVDTHKTVRSNAFLFAALHRGILSGAVTDQNNFQPLRALFTSRTGVNDGFLTLVFDQNGFIPSASSDFQEGDAGAPADHSYSASANADAIEALNEQWLGVQGAPASLY
jgi:hypothetical protein